MFRSKTGIIWRVSPKAFNGWAAKGDQGGAGKSNTTDSSGGNGNSTDNAGNEDDPEGEEPEGDADPKPDEKAKPKYSDNDMAAFRRKMEKEVKDKAEKAKQDAEDAQAVEQGKAKELAERYKARIEVLEPENTRMAEVISTFVDSQITDWPPSLKKLIPVEGTAIERYEAYERSQEAAAEMMASKKGKQEGDGKSSGNGQDANRENPPPRRQQNDADDDNSPEASAGSRNVMRAW